MERRVRNGREPAGRPIVLPEHPVEPSAPVEDDMLRGVRLFTGLTAILIASGGVAHSQYYGGGFGNYGWGGWGGATPQGEIARGMGMYNVGAGVYNEKTAVANSINADTVMRITSISTRPTRKAVVATAPTWPAGTTPPRPTTTSGWRGFAIIPTTRISRRATR